jgi:hypothetical protein
MSRLTIVLCAAHLLSLGATAMNAQSSSYDENALRVESYRGDLQVVRGVHGTVVARAGVFRGPKVADLVSQSEQALEEARAFERDYQPGLYAAALGIATFGAALGVSRINDISILIPTGLTAASMVLIAYGGAKLHKANQALSRAIWWYNRDLKR